MWCCGSRCDTCPLISVYVTLTTIVCTLHYPGGLNLAIRIGVFRRDDDVLYLSRNMLHCSYVYKIYNLIVTDRLLPFNLLLMLEYFSVI